MVGNKLRLGWLIIDRQHIKYYLQGAVVIVLLMWVWGYVSLWNSSSYSFGVEYVKSNHALKEAVGEIQSTRLGLVNFKESYSSGTAKAKFHIVVKGNKKSGDVLLDIESTVNGWKVNDATLDTDNGLVTLKASDN